MCDLDVMGAPSKVSVIRKAAALARARPTFALSCEESRAAEVELATVMLRKLNS